VDTQRNARPSGSTGALLAGFLLFIAAAATALAPGTARSTVAYDFEGPVYYRPGETVKDHSLIRIGDTFHLYFIVDVNGREKSFGHATSTDLRHWTRQPDVLFAGPEAWDAAAIWAPTVVPYPVDPRFLIMYYTGVNTYYAQRMGFAMTSDLKTFYKAPSASYPPFHGDTSWMYWYEDQWSNYRDPGFFKENDTCYMVHTAHTWDWKGAIALATSTDYFTWHDAGPIYVADNWHAIESVFLMKRNGRYHLFFTEEAIEGISHMSSDSLRSGWNIATRTVIDLGAASELLDLGDDHYIFSRHTKYTTAAEPISSIRFDTLGWYGDQPHVNMTNLLGGWKILWGTAFDRQPVFGDNPRFRGDFTTTIGFEGNWWIGTYERFNGPISGPHPGEIQGDMARGAIRSEAFIVTGSSMRLLVGGGNYPDSCYVALCDASTGAILCRETGKNTDRLDERLWDLTPYRGKSAYLTIVDNCVSPFGHINVDGIEERTTGVLPPGGGRGGTGKSHSEGSTKSSAKPDAGPADGPAGAPAHVSPSLSSSPNPFNPETEILARGEPGTIVTVSIYDVAGHSLCDLEARTDAGGEATIRWNGTDRHGARLPSGVYLAVLKSGGRILARSKLVLAR
jgi:predicted GH43/DUF377 family glycosyl hydrolase